MAAACLILVISLSAMALIGVDIKWEDRGLTLRIGQEVSPGDYRAGTGTDCFRQNVTPPKWKS